MIYKLKGDEYVNNLKPKPYCHNIITYVHADISHDIFHNIISWVVDLLVIMAAKFWFLKIWRLSWQFDDLSETNLLSSNVSTFCVTENVGLPVSTLLNSLEAKQQH